MRLSGWLRVGIVASVLWVVAGGLWASHVSIESRTAPVSVNWRQCDEAAIASDARDPPTPSDDSPDFASSPRARECSRRFSVQYVEAVQGHWIDAALVAFAPLPIFWAASWALLVTARWVRQGFR